MDTEDLINAAKKISVVKQLSNQAISGEVGCALVSATGKLYTGVSLSTGSGLGACAEYSAVVEMLKEGESQIQKIVAVSSDGKVLPPCGRCRELLFQIDKKNLDTKILVNAKKTLPLKDLLTYRWQEAWDTNNS